MAKSPSWTKLLLGFIAQLRILSRDETARPGEVGTKLKLWNSQARILDAISAAMDKGIRKFYVLKSRQLGSSTVFVIICLFWLALHPRMKGALVVDQEKTRDKFREEIRNMINSIPEGYGAMRIRKGGDNRNMMRFSNGSQLDFLVAGTSANKVAWGESSGYSLVILSELANYGSEEGLSNFEEAMTDKHPDRLFVYESTAKGFNHWRKRWLKAKEDIFDCLCIFVGWWSKEDNSLSIKDPKFAVYGLAPPDEREREKIRVVKERHGHEITREQLAWYRSRQNAAGASESSLAQNQPWVEEDAFIQSGKSFFQTRLIGQDYERIGTVAYMGYRFWLARDFWKTEVERIEDQLRKQEIELRVWEQPMPEGRYVIGVDPAGGSSDKNDRHAINVFRCYADKLIQVAEYADNECETRHCAWVLAYLAGTYKNCQINLELSGGYGKAVLTELEHIKELMRADFTQDKKNVRGDPLGDFLDNARYYIYRRPDTPMAAGYIIHMNTTNELKAQIFSEFRDAHRIGAAVVNSRSMLDEMLIIEQKGIRIEASGDDFDDRTFAACLACHTWVQHERGPLIMMGETYEAVCRREAGGRDASTMVDALVAQTMRQLADGVSEEPDPARSWLLERGLV